MARVAFLLQDEFADSELRTPWERLKDAGHELVVVGEERGRELHGKRGEETAVVEVPADEVRAADWDGLVIPGGGSPDKLRLHAGAVGFTRAMVESGKPVGAICHGGSLLVEADVVRGRRVTSWPSIRRDLENAGALWVNEAVVEDRGLITARYPGDLQAFADALVRHLGAVDWPAR